ncbi:methionyl-tRNA formyltransferase [Candidatus Falkowbacteria bacterium CG10_big_fil_rev_8_21_14_0_10_39_11]|uniref:Methionyl-tRNA formyltransferase n=1 Tax=Candidatus Falkowbacteria bacterium CG10_big_fil_rev_8_21_14_0_10_39_11 TaxID=1974565 RepID=A0A2H0V684_9BACT|nr:MAG: methionyl-tRNA formyltransferase [Candidatus Falkowbacteria bacterium CG10_big_fil_rev_8_21_14_0_10_39_11]
MPETNKRKIVFMGTSEFAVPILKSLNDCYDVVLVVVSPDKPTGRKQAITPPPVKILANELGLKVEQPTKLRGNEEFFNTLKKVNPEVIVVVAYGKILPAEIINLPEHGCINVHGSILPKYRGPSPIQTALINGEKETGISFILMDLGMDTGDVIRKYSINIESEDDFNSLSGKLSALSAEKVCKVVEQYVNGDTNLEMQEDDEATYCYKITETMGRIQWSLSARAIANRIRAIGGKVGVYTFFDEKRLRIIEAEGVDSHCVKDNASISVGTVFQGVDPETNIKMVCVKCGKGRLILKKVQLEGRQPMAIKDFVNGQQKFVGSVLS